MTPCVPHPGRLREDGYGEVGRHDRAHVVAWEAVNGPVPEGFVLDHTCHNLDASCPGGNGCPHRACISVLHLEVVTRGENTRRGNRDTCRRGHPLTEDNVAWNGHARTCRTCRDDKHREWKRANQAAYRARKKKELV